MKILIVIDAQNDFIYGELGSKDAEKALKNIENELKNKYDITIFTHDIHDKETYLSTQEGKQFPIYHCIKNTFGSELAIKKELIPNEAIHVYKNAFGYSEWKNLFFPNNILTEKDTITIVGFCTDICVLVNALILKTCFPESLIEVIDNCCAGTTKEKHNAAIQAMNSCQIKII